MKGSCAWDQGVCGRKQGAPLHVDMKGVVGVGGFALSHFAVFYNTIFLTALSWYLQTKGVRAFEKMWCCLAGTKKIKQGAASMQLRPEPFSKDSIVWWGQVRETKGKVWASYGPHRQMAASLPFCFSGEKIRCYRFSAINEGSSPTCQMCYVTDVHEPVWMQAPHNTWEGNDTLYFSPPLAGPQTHPVLILSPACQPSSRFWHTFSPTPIIPRVFSTTRTHAHVDSNPQAPFHPPAFPLSSPQSLALLFLRCSAAPAHTPSWYLPVLTRLSYSLSLNAQCCNRAVTCSVQSCVYCQTHICSQVAQNKTNVYQG